MKTLYLECNMGAAGDMLMAALLELSNNPTAFLDRLNKTFKIQGHHLPQVKVTAAPSVKCGITGTHVSVYVNGQEEESSDMEHEHSHHHHDHGHNHHHHNHGDHDDGHHHHSGMEEIRHIIGHLDISEKVKADVLSVYNLIAEAESKAHNQPIDQIHFHEVGTMDAIADVVGVCMLMEELAPQKVAASPIHVGSGQVRCAHGVLPVPAPATARILTGVPIYGGSVKAELCTPTGAALLKHFVSDFSGMPVMTVYKTGYGMGSKDFEQANCVRAFIGEAGVQGRDRIVQLACNLDDMTGEAVGFAADRLMEAGALDVYTTAITMKKGRPAVMLTCLCTEADKDQLAAAMFKHTTTLGIRCQVAERYILSRRSQRIDTPYGQVRIKSAQGWGVSREKAEYEDISGIAKEQGVSFLEAGEMIKAVSEDK